MTVIKCDYLSRPPMTVMECHSDGMLVTEWR